MPPEEDVLHIPSRVLKAAAGPSAASARLVPVEQAPPLAFCLNADMLFSASPIASFATSCVSHSMGAVGIFPAMLRGLYSLDCT